MEEQENNNITETTDNAAENAENADGVSPCKKEKKQKYCGAYWYSLTEDDELKKQSSTRDILVFIALTLQLVVLLLPQGGLQYVTENIPSYAYAYMWTIFAFFAISVYTIAMCLTRSKIIKRIPVEHAPKNGFVRRSFLCSEIYTVANAVIFIMEFSFMCIHFDGIGLLAMFLCLLSTAAAVWARMIPVFTLKDAERIEPDEEEKE